MPTLRNVLHNAQRVCQKGLRKTSSPRDGEVEVQRDVDKLMDTVRKRRVLYARVSSNTQRDDLVKGQIPTRIG